MLELGDSKVLNIYLYSVCMHVSHVSGILIAVHTVLSEVLNRACTNAPKADKAVLIFLYRHLN